MYHIIINPAARSGQGKKVWDIVKDRLEELDVHYKVYFSRAPGHTIDLAKGLCEKAKSQYKDIHIIVMGGDGTVNEAVQGIVDFDNTIFSYIPIGSSNDLARNLGISFDPLEALESIINKTNDVHMDLGIMHYNNASYYGTQIDVPDRRFVVSCGIGFDAAVCESVNTSRFKAMLNKVKLGKVVYVGTAISKIIWSRYVEATITLDDNEPINITKLFFAVFMNHPYEGGGFKFCPEANPYDGVIDGCVISTMSRSKILSILPSGYDGTHYRYDGVEAYKAKEILVEANEPLWVHTDGETKAQTTSISIKCLEGKLHFIY